MPAWVNATTSSVCMWHLTITYNALAGATTFKFRGMTSTTTVATAAGEEALREAQTLRTSIASGGATAVEVYDGGSRVDDAMDDFPAAVDDAFTAAPAPVTTAAIQVPLGAVHALINTLGQSSRHLQYVTERSTFTLAASPVVP